ncbi:hypothetical protein CSQ96_09465 [Janthinobacterium sp. BJB412]|nr:hypothetical protein CSQ96_09465 [Janthinobacterium sp. BJB412]
MSAAAASCRLHIVSAGARWPAWARDMVAAMLAQPGAHWQGWTVVPGAAPRPGWGERLYLAFDRKVMAPGLSVDGAVAPPAAPVPTTAEWRATAAGTEVPDAVLRAWRADGVDLVVWLLPRPPVLGAVPAGLAVWALSLDGASLAADPLAGARSVRSAPHLCETRLLDYAATPPAVLYRSVSAAVTNSLAATRRRALKKSQAFMARRLAQRLGRQAAGQPQQADAAAPPAPAAAPGGLALLGHVAARVVRNRVERRRHLDQWQIAFSFDPAVAWERLDRFHFIVPPAAVFWADPMPLYWQQRHWIMFEELPFAAPRGRLLALEVKPDGSHGAPLPVMERPHHLSYPFMLKDGGQLYMVPETSATRRVELYRCVDFPGQWQLEAVLLDGVNAVDTTILRHSDGRWWMWVSVVEEGAERGEELHVYFAEQLAGPWQPHAANPVVSDIRCARPAGPVVADAAGLLRPAQNSAQGYGHHIEWRRITRLTPTEYREEAAGSLQPQGDARWLRMHTVAEADGLKVVDVMVRRAR